MVPTLEILIGESGSGKTTLACQMVSASRGKLVRVNRDTLRDMLYADQQWKPQFEDLVISAEKFIVECALAGGRHIIVDDTNLNPKIQTMWECFANEHMANFKATRLDTPYSDCVSNNAERKGKDRLPIAVINRQFLKSKRLPITRDPIVIVDIDGTLANSDGVRSPYDESRVGLDKPYEVVVKWVKEIGKYYQVILVSGRHDSCCRETQTWLAVHEVPYYFLLMRQSGDNRPDNIIKQEILDLLLECVPKSQIAFVIDDRPRVIAMWKSNGLKVYPARGLLKDF